MDDEPGPHQRRAAPPVADGKRTTWDRKFTPSASGWGSSRTGRASGTPRARQYAQLLAEDLDIRALIKRRLANASVSRAEIERSLNEVKLTIHTAKPGIVIGKQGAAVEELRRNLEALTGKKARVNIMEIRQPELDARLVARSVAEQLERRVAFRRAMKQAVQRTMRMGAKGIRIRVAGRLGGSEMARTDKDVRRQGAPADAARRHRLRAVRGRHAPTGGSASRSGSTAGTSPRARR